MVRLSSGRIESPVFDQKYRFVRPAIGCCVIDGEEHFYFQLWLPTEIYNGESLNVEAVMVSPWMVLDDGRIIRWNEGELFQFNLVPEGGVARFPLKWGLEDIKMFCEKLDAPSPIEVYNSIIALLKEYIEFQFEEHYHVVALWIIGTYLHAIFETYPYLYIGGAKGVGKTKTLRFIEMLSFNAVNSINVSSASLYRICQGMAATLLIDETGYLSNKGRYEDLRTLLYGRYKAGQWVQRVEKRKNGKLEVESFRVYGPTALANIEGLEDILADRSIEIIMLRTRKAEIANKEIVEDNPEWQKIRNSLYRIALKHWGEIKRIYRELGGEIKLNIQISGRQLERWKPLIAIAIWLSEEPSKMLLKAIQTLEREKSYDDVETIESITLVALARNVNEDGYYPVKDVRRWIADEMGEEDISKWLNERTVGRVLKRLGFTDKRKVSSGVEYMLRPRKIREVCERMNITLEEPIENYKTLIACADCMKTLNPTETQFTGQTGKCELCGRVAEIFKVKVKI
jgi:hypothetical protein